MPPMAEKKDTALTVHGDTRIDPYYWLRERENPQVISYLEAENAYLDTVMQPLAAFKQQLFEEMKGRIKETDASVPYRKNGYYYYTRYTTGKEYLLYCRKKGSLEAPEEIILDVNELAEGHAYYQVGGMAVSPDTQWLVFGVDTVSRRQYTLHIKNLSTGEILPERIPDAAGAAVAWANDNNTFFYTVKNPVTLRAERVMRHVKGTDAAQDTEMYFENDEEYSAGVGRCKSGKFIFIESESTLSSEYRILDADKPDETFTVFQPRLNNVLYRIDHQDDKFYVITNYEAVNFRLMFCGLTHTTLEHWTEAVPHRADVLLEDIELFREHLVLSERSQGLTHLRVIHTPTREEHYLQFDEPAYVASLSVNPEFDTQVLRYTYTSLTTPMSTFDYDMVTRNQELRKRQEVVGGYDPADYVTERIFATARDGVKVPVSIVYKKGAGPRPLLLYGYGSYGNSVDPVFSSVRLSLLNRGFAFAIAHIRGGEDMGRQWYEDGKMFKKMNTFTDFIDCAEHLIALGYTSSDHLYAMGASAGGLLVGAVANMRPSLFNGIIAGVPFVDVVTTMLDESIPLTTGEFNEWGNPQHKDAYDYMKSYSPYDNVTAQAYPNMLVTTGLHDSQVQYWEPAKWVARLRELKTDDHLLLLHTNMTAGHGGASGRFKPLEEIALQYAFLLKLENK